MAEQHLVAVQEDRVQITFERSLYPIDAIYGASYVFIDRCFVLLDTPDPDHIAVELRGRESLDPAALRDLAGEFGNELLTQTWRQQVTRNNRSIVEAVAARAMSGAVGPGLDEAPGDFSADAFDDPLGIAVPWEEKYGKKESE